jgi:Caspase domain
VAGQRKALIIAIDVYEHEGLKHLRAPAADAEALAGVLGDPRIGGFDVQVIRNEPAHVIGGKIEDLFSDSRADDVLLLHFSCHGLKSESGELFFAARNTRPNRLGSTAIAADFVQRSMRASRSRSIVLLLDCCYGGAFSQGVSVRAAGDVNVLDSFPGGRLGGGRGRAVITASSAMEYAFDGDQLADDKSPRPSVFTSALVEGLASGDADRDQDGWVSLNELYDYVFDRVREQNPHQTPSRDVEMQGELYLARRSRPVTTAAPLPPELLEVIDHPLAGVRAGAVHELARLLLGRHAGLALAARIALERLAQDDSRTVAAVAAATLVTADANPGEAHIGVPIPEDPPSTVAAEQAPGADNARTIRQPIDVPETPEAGSLEAQGDAASTEDGRAARHTPEQMGGADLAPTAGGTSAVPGPHPRPNDVTFDEAAHERIPPGPALSQADGSILPPLTPVRSSRGWLRVSLTVAAGVVSVMLVSWAVWASIPDRAAPGTGALSPTTSAPSPTRSVPRFGSWEPGPNLLTPVEAAGMAAHLGAIWVIGGDTLASPYMTRDVQVLDPSKRRWSKGPSLPVPLRDAVAVSTGKTLYVLGGITPGGVVGTVYRLDENGRSWILDPRALPEPRAAGAGAWDGSRLLFAGGADASGRDRADVWALGANRWDAVAQLSQPRNSLGAASDGAGTTWFLAGQRGAGAANGKIPATGVVDRLRGKILSPLRPLGARRAVSATFVAGAGPCVVGGVPDLSLSADPAMECPFAPPGTNAPPLHTGRGGIGAAVLNGQLFAVGGFPRFGQNGSVTVEVLPLH